MFISRPIGRRHFSSSLSGPWNYVGGRRCVPIDSLGIMKVTEPATGKLLTDVPVSGTDEVNRAVDVASKAFKEWSLVSPRERGRCLTQAGGIIRDHLEDIAKLEVRDSGKPIWEARVDIASCADALEYFGGVALAATGQHVQLGGGSFAMVTREPYGVVAGIGAWNFPMQTCVWKAAPALACGNTFVYKPSQFTPVTAAVLGEVLASAGLRAGVYNVVQGEGETGALLCRHPGVQKLSFTGSVATGTKVMACGAEDIKAVSLELGGKSPLIVFGDAHIENAVKATLLANFLSQGQVCSNGTRVYVHKSIFGAFTELLVEQTRQLRIGDPFLEDVTVGATIHEGHARKVLGYVDAARREGARVLCGGERVQLSGDLAGGWYLSPCVLTNVDHSMKVVQEEVFGSVASVMEFESEEEAVSLANDSAFGLAGGVFTKDVQRGFRVARRLEAGSVWLNAYNCYPPEVPFGGFKRSGVGRENGQAALECFSQTKTVYVEAGDVDAGPLFRPRTQLEPTS